MGWVSIRRILLRKAFSRGRMKISGEIFNRGDLTEFLYGIHVNCLKLALLTQFSIWRCSGGIIRGLFSMSFDFWKNSTEGGIIE